MFDTDPFFPVLFDATPATCPAWMFTNPQELLGRGAQVDTNLPLPERPGRLLREPVTDQLVFDGIWEIGCDVDPDGAPYADPVIGYATNRRLWLAEFFDADPLTRSAQVSVEDPAGTEYVGVVQFGEPRFVETLTGGTAYMRITIPDGQLAEVTSP